MTDDHPKTTVENGSSDWAAPGWSYSHLLLLVLFPIIISLVVRIPFIEHGYTVTMEYIEDMGAWGPLAFIGLYIVASVLMCPDTFLNMSAGLIWGVGTGSLVVFAGRGIGSLLTFVLVRTVARRFIERRTAREPMVGRVCDAISHDGFKVALLVRLCPAFPVSVMNYVLALPRISLTAFVMATFLGLIPRTLVRSYVGAAGGSLADLAAGDGRDAIYGDPVVFWSGLVVTFLAAVLIMRIAHRALKQALSSGEQARA